MDFEHLGLGFEVLELGFTENVFVAFHWNSYTFNAFSRPNAPKVLETLVFLRVLCRNHTFLQLFTGNMCFCRFPFKFMHFSDMFMTKCTKSIKNTYAFEGPTLSSYILNTKAWLGAGFRGSGAFLKLHTEFHTFSMYSYNKMRKKYPKDWSCWGSDAEFMHFYKQEWADSLRATTPDPLHSP